MSKNKTIREKILKYPVSKWPWKSKEKYYRWVKETYGDVVCPDSYVDGYRAWKQLVWSMDVQINKPQIITAQHVADEALEIINNIFKEEYSKHEHNLT